MSPTVAKENTNTLEIQRHVSVVLANADGKPSVILADTTGNVPSKFELLKVGAWRTPYHGDIMIMPSDGEAYIENFKAGYGVSGNNMGKLPINYAHESWNKAAGWFVPEFDGETLWATEVEWTPAAKKALQDGEWKCISAEFCPAGRGGWLNPLNDEQYIENVLTGAALTNIPLFSQLEPVMASATFGKDEQKSSVFLLTANENKEPQKMDLKLADIRVKEVDALTDAEKDFLSAKKDELTTDEKTKFGFEVAASTEAPAVEPATPAAPAPVAASVNGIDPAVAASIVSGESVVIASSELQKIREQTDAYAKEKAQAKVMAHVARGAIKADQVDAWTEKVLADSSMEALMDTLPSNPAMAVEQGQTGNNSEVKASEQVKKEAEALMEKDNSLKIGDAVSKVLASNPALAADYELETKGQVK